MWLHSAYKLIPRDDKQRNKQQMESGIVEWRIQWLGPTGRFIYMTAAGFQGHSVSRHSAFRCSELMNPPKPS